MLGRNIYALHHATHDQEHVNSLRVFLPLQYSGLLIGHGKKVKFCRILIYACYTRFKCHATVVPNSVDRIKFDFSTASLAMLHGSSSTWF